MYRGHALLPPACGCLLSQEACPPMGPVACPSCIETSSWRDRIVVNCRVARRYEQRKCDGLEYFRCTGRRMDCRENAGGAETSNERRRPKSRRSDEALRKPVDHRFQEQRQAGGYRPLHKAGIERQWHGVREIGENRPAAHCQKGEENMDNTTAEKPVQRIRHHSDHPWRTRWRNRVRACSSSRRAMYR